MKKYFVVSDVHSFFDELIVALNEKDFEKDNPEHILCVCGDLFDRGIGAVKIFEFVKELQKQGRLIYVKGNHEWLLEKCVDEIHGGRFPSWHHFSNGTIKTICSFCGEGEWIMYDETWRGRICEIMQPILNFINENCVNYAEIGNHILVHGWIPSFQHIDDFRDGSDDDWNQAMWMNGMDMWRNPKNRINGKTIVCGHYHVNWGHSRIHCKCSEWGDDAIFQPFIDDGIIAIDACTVHSGLINCIVLEG